jgi:hypothetical protein
MKIDEMLQGIWSAASAAEENEIIEWVLETLGDRSKLSPTQIDMIRGLAIEWTDLDASEGAT